MPGGGVWHIAQGGTGLSNLMPDTFVSVNSGGLFENVMSVPLQNTSGGTGYSYIPADKFLTTDVSGNLVASYSVPSSAFVGVSDTQTLTNKIFTDSTSFVASPTALSFGNVYNINYVAPLSTTALKIKDPGANTDFLFTSGTQSLFNKTITDSTNAVGASSFKYPSGTISVNSAGTIGASQYLTANSSSVAVWKYPKMNAWFAQTATLTLVYSQLSTGASMESVTGVGTLIIPSSMRATGLTLKARYKGYFRPNGDSFAYTLTFNNTLGGTSTRTMAVSYANTNQNNTFDIEIVTWFVTSTTVISWITYVGQNGTTAVFNQTNTLTSTPITVAASSLLASTIVTLTGGTGPNCQLIIYSVTLDAMQA
jgi:hypothetical protein